MAACPPLSLAALECSLCAASCAAARPAGGIPRLSGTISYEEFFTEHLLKNLPAVIEESLVHDWPCLKNWRTDTPRGPRINWDYLRHHFGASRLPLACAGPPLTLAAYIDTHCQGSEAAPPPTPPPYFKDWHFFREFAAHPTFCLPQLFHDDWLNHFCDTHVSREGQHRDDFRFVYVGAAHTCTPLHHDVLSSFSWSTNVAGTKLWLFFPPALAPRLLDPSGAAPALRLADDGCTPRLDEADLERMPDFPLADGIVLKQHSGETVFVPSGWYHQVWNLEATVSINHNWANACNLHHMWQQLHDAMATVSNHLTDLDVSPPEWEDLRQRILKADSGFDVPTFIDFLAVNGDAILQRLCPATLNAGLHSGWRECPGAHLHKGPEDLCLSDGDGACVCWKRDHVSLPRPEERVCIFSLKRMRGVIAVASRHPAFQHACAAGGLPSCFPAIIHLAAYFHLCRSCR
mmetsp:Transcript_32504/g.81457  ORF Transcript_32504/g.81457 Transcript_32504/m.81457 type:complete len:461 (+) Transcript_32504:91-1473(+)